MNIELKQYLDDKTILLDVLDTYPKHIKKLISENVPLLNEYFDEEQSLHEKHLQMNYFPTYSSNKYYQAYNSLVDKIVNYLSENCYYALSFHATRLLSQEITDIKTNGFKLFNKNEHSKKLDLLNAYGFNKSEIDILKNCSYVENGQRSNKVYFCHAISTLNFDNGLNPFFSTWGGEITYWHKDIPSNILNRLKCIGIPCLVIAKLPIFQITSVSYMIKSLLHNFITKSQKEDIDTSLTTNDIVILDVISFDKFAGDKVII